MSNRYRLYNKQTDEWMYVLMSDEGKTLSESVYHFHKGDNYTNKPGIDIDAVIRLANLMAYKDDLLIFDLEVIPQDVSIENKKRIYRPNFIGSFSLLDAHHHKPNNLVFTQDFNVTVKVRNGKQIKPFTVNNTIGPS